MTLLNIAKIIKDFPTHITRNKEAYAYINNDTYRINKIKYVDGEPVGFYLEFVNPE